MGLRIVSKHSHSGCSRGSAAAKAGNGRQLAAPFSDRTRSGIPVPAVMSQPATVLIVEDAETCASTLEIIFSSIRGLRVLTAYSAEQAWELIQSENQHIRALVTDIHMPGMDGFELIDRVRATKAYAGLPIVVITGSTDPDVSGR